jgi:hypothetical protein
MMALALAAVLAGAFALAGAPRATRLALAAGQVLDRYSLVHGCYRISSAGAQIAPGDAPFRMQAAALGEYLLYGVHDDFVGQDLQPVATPSQATTWRVTGDSRSGFTLTNDQTGSSQAATFTPAGGCAVYPEAQVDATGPAFTGATGAGLVSGTVDAHTHVTAFEFLGGDFHCGRPWSPYGAPYALPDCKPYEQGSNGLVESFLDYGSASNNHDMAGWPTFKSWPSPTNLAEEGDYYTGLERAWKAGLRIFVTHLVDNEALCDLMTKRHTPCNDMQSVFIQAQDLKALQDYIDAQSGGPGKGFFRIVTNPFQARQVINEGKLAVEEGIEVSDLFNCGESGGVPKCGPAQVDQGLAAVRKIGVTTFFPIHKFDNAFGGTKMDGGELGILVNGGNHLETGSFWDVRPCTGSEHDSQQISVPGPGALLDILNGPGAKLLGGSPLPLYQSGPSCNQRGLTPLGTYLLNKMMDEHFIIQLDHMDALTADQTLAVIEKRNYSGVVSAHSWDSPQENPPIYRLGGFVNPIAGSSPQAFVADWRADRAIADPRFYFGFGYGADMNGLAEQSEPTNAHPITYPFRSYDGKVTFTREVWGDRTFDINTDGVANYGMYADWLQELGQLGGRPMLTDMMRGAEAYLEMWERAEGVPEAHCLTGARPALGQGFERVLYSLGQPASRTGSAYRYCAGAGRTLSVVFSAAGRVRLWATSAPAYRVGGVQPGERANRVHAHAHSLGHGLWLGRHGLVYGARRGRVSFVGVTAIPHRADLRAAVRAAGL